MEKISAEFKGRCRQDVRGILDLLEHSIPHLQKMAAHLTVTWQPEQPSLMHHHNHYVDLLMAVYISKHLAYTENLISSLNRLDYLGYALNSRSIVETVSTLHYYMNTKYLPALQSESIDLQELLKVHDKHLRGTRFDWERFISKKFEEMADEVIRKISEKNKKSKLKKSAKRIQNAQVNVLTCIERWACEAPVVMILYELLCEMVHPNLGSNFLVASTENGRFNFGRHTGTPVGHNLFESTIGWLLPVGYKEFGKLICALALTKYQPDEL